MSAMQEVEATIARVLCGHVGRSAAEHAAAEVMAALRDEHGLTEVNGHMPVGPLAIETGPKATRLSTDWTPTEETDR